MGLNVKVGKGGHGYEVYDEEGKYADEFSFEIEGQQIKGYDDFRALCFNSMVASGNSGPYDAQQLEQIYQQNLSGFKDNIDGALMEEYHTQLMNAVYEHNAKQIWDTPEDAAKHLHELFVPALVQNLVENGFVDSAKSSVANHYQVSTLAACVQMSRYKNNRAQVISQEDYDKEIAENAAPEFQNDWDLKKYISNGCANHNSIPLIRDISGVARDDMQNVMDSFYDENSPRHSCLATYGQGYLGSVVYFAKIDRRYGWDSYNNVSIQGLVKLDENLRLLNCNESGRPRCRNAIPEIVRFKQAIRNDKDFDSRMLETFKTNGGVDDIQAQKMLDRLKYEIEDDTGLSAILMGYDAIYGIEGYQFDLLNLNILHIIK